eukprot:CAMPEP_0197004196 /NCGR_PEP_ID=MMETSP1380-20130617/20149_1 /TAXON_ID=5936 /ORGANISM="Euplotes crassus, Strain CT5" /LENGTH=131 /DNA_ID=CAMNT_0042422913 /DNA_START=15 /DNA_END=410 /DNA_ORIENTATION=-
MDKLAINITFDENNQIRVLEADKYRESENLKGECMDFLKKIVTFNDNVEQLIVILDEQAKKIEEQKLKAVGARNRIEGEEDNCRKKEQELKTLINERKMELGRLISEHESLKKIEQEQKNLIDKLSNNEAS